MEMFSKVRGAGIILVAACLFNAVCIKRGDDEGCLPWCLPPTSEESIVGRDWLGWNSEANGDILRLGDLIASGCRPSSELALSSDCGRDGDLIFPPLDSGGLARCTAANAAEASEPVDVGLVTRSSLALVKEDALDRICA